MVDIRKRKRSAFEFYKKRSEILSGIQSDINKTTKGFWKDVPFRKGIIIFLIINLVVILAVLLGLHVLPPEVPLFYGQAEGAEQLVSSQFLIVPSLSCILLFTINSFIEYFIKDGFLAKTLTFVYFIASFFSTITTIRIFFLVAGV